MPIYESIDRILDRGLVYAKPVLDSLNKHYTLNWHKVLLVTNKKLTISKTSFSHKSRYLIRGLASSIGGNFAFVSTYKLKAESDSESMYNELLIKTIRHEFGHMIGLPHCNSRDDHCLMISGYDPERFQILDYQLCENCKGLLDSLTNY